jgi:PadR family transcriptional regulator, regulatory protein PadR
MSAESGQVQGHLEGLILAVMVSGPCHGYEVIRRLTASSGGLFDLPEGTVYPALYRLEKSGALASAWQTVDGRRRRVYSITDAGRVRLGERRERWRLFSDAISRILGAGAGTAGAGGSA